MSEGAKEEVGCGGGVFQGLEGLGEEDLSFYPEGGGSPGRLWGRGGAGPDSGAPRRPLAAAGRTDYYIELCQPNLQMRKLSLRKVNDLSRVTVTRGLLGAGTHGRKYHSMLSFWVPTHLQASLCGSASIFLCLWVSAAVSFLTSLSLSISRCLSLSL